MRGSRARSAYGRHYSEEAEENAMTKAQPSETPLMTGPVHYEAIDIKLTTPEANFGCRAAARSVPALAADLASSLAHFSNPTPPAARYPELYSRARSLAQREGITFVLSVGGDRIDPLARVFADERYQLSALLPHTHMTTIAEAREQYPRGQWLTAHLGAKHELEAAFAAIEAGEAVNPHACLVLLEGLERILDPRNLLFEIRGLLLRRPGSRLVVATPDRARTSGADYEGLPPDPTHVREWTLDEITTFLASSGFTVARAEHIRTSTDETAQGACCLELKCDPAAYDTFLLQHGFAHTNASYAALLTAEHATLAVTGGIGTYASYVAKLDGAGIITVYVGPLGSATPEEMTESGWIHPRLFFGGSWITSWPPIEVAWKTTEHLLFFFHNIEIIEYQDYQGLGARVAQAKRSGLISPSICVQVQCHGNQAYVDIANESWHGLSSAETWVVERVAIEQADRIFIPSEYLYDLYRDVGYDMSDRVVIQRLPFTYASTDPFSSGSHPNCPEAVEFAEVDTLIFFGKLAPLKGISHFLDAVHQLAEAKALHRIKDIVFLGGRVQLDSATEARLQALEQDFHVEYHAGSRDEVLSTLRSRRTHSLVVMPYLGDNHPYSVLEAIDLGISFLTYERGGIPSLIPEAFRENVLAQPTPAALAAQIRQMLAMGAADRQYLFRELRNACVDEQTQINDECLHTQFRHNTDQRVLSAIAPRSDQVTVVVAVYNTQLAYVRDLCHGLNAQTLAPKEIIFVNDGSRPGYAEDLKSLLEAELAVPWRLISQANRGLSGAFNSGLRACETDYMVGVDSDDVPTPDHVYDLVRRLVLDPGIWAAISYIKYFHEEQSEDWGIQRLDGGWYRPIGETLIYGQIRNVLGSSCAAFHVQRLRSIGGWDESDKSKWVDWALYLKIVSNGGTLGYVPKLGMLYRVHAQSMSRTYPEFPATRRLARATTILPRWEAYCLQAMMRDQQNRLVAEQNAMLDELRQWGADQQALIAAQERDIAERNTMLAELRSMGTELRQWSTDQAAYILRLEQELEAHRADFMQRLLSVSPLQRLLRRISYARAKRTRV
jgi:GT2 family glycosyltransferase/glycosyltransferase involved in cell wall biosynthesis